MSEETGGISKMKLTFMIQIGLCRDQVNFEGDLTLSVLKDIACGFVDKKVSSVTCQMFLLNE